MNFSSKSSKYRGKSKSRSRFISHSKRVHALVPIFRELEVCEIKEKNKEGFIKIVKNTAEKVLLSLRLNLSMFNIINNKNATFRNIENFGHLPKIAFAPKIRLCHGYGRDKTK